MRLRGWVIGLALLAALPGSALGATVTVNSRFPAPAPAQSEVLVQKVIVGFNIAVLDPTSPTSTWIVQQVLAGGGVGPALPGGVATPTDPNDPKTWNLTFPSFLGSSTTYRVTLINVRPKTNSGNNSLTSSTWDFSIAPDPGRAPGVLNSLTASPSDGAVALSWDEPLDFDRAGVMIYRRAGAAVPTTADELVGTYPEGQTSAVDAAVLPGATYTYAAFPYDRDTPPNVGPPVVAGPVTLAAPAVQIAPIPVPAPAPTPTPAPPPVAPVVKKPVATTKLVVPAATVLTAGKAQRLRWKRNAEASYYNVQLFKGKRKLLSTFPSSASELIPAKLLKATGSYRLLVWSGLGSRTLGRYERTPWISRAFTVRAAKTAPAKKGPAKKA